MTQTSHSANDDTVEVIIETPKESRIKFKYNPSEKLYEIDRILPHGLRFPFNFGFVPGTVAPDGDPTDVLIILDESLFPGCRVACRVLGLLQAAQTENGRTNCNDRIVAVSIKDKDAPHTVDDIPRNFFDDFKRFFVTYHEAEGNHFKVLGIAGVRDALELVHATRRNRR